MPEPVTISRVDIPAEGQDVAGADLRRLIALRNADMRRVRGSEEHSLTVEQALTGQRQQQRVR